MEDQTSLLDIGQAELLDFKRETNVLVEGGLIEATECNIRKR